MRIDGSWPRYIAMSLSNLWALPFRRRFPSYFVFQASGKHLLQQRCDGTDWPRLHQNRDEGLAEIGRKAVRETGLRSRVQHRLDRITVVAQASVWFGLGREPKE
jgi:hypothetical protein